MKYNKHRPSTKKTYHSVWTNFNKFIVRLDWIPTAWEERTSLFCAYLTETTDVQSATLKSYVSAIKDKLKTDGYRWDDELVYFSALTRSCKLKNDVMEEQISDQTQTAEFLDD